MDKHIDKGTFMSSGILLWVSNLSIADWGIIVGITCTVIATMYGIWHKYRMRKILERSIDVKLRNAEYLRDPSLEEAYYAKTITDTDSKLD